MFNIRILFTDYAIIAYFLNLEFCSEHFISVKHRIMASFNANKKFNSDSIHTAFNCCKQNLKRQKITISSD